MAELGAMGAQELVGLGHRRAVQRLPRAWLDLAPAPDIEGGYRGDVRFASEGLAIGEEPDGRGVSPASTWKAARAGWLALCRARGPAAPARAARGPRASSRWGATSVHSRAGASRALPPSRLARRNASRSIGPDGGMPTRSEP